MQLTTCRKRAVRGFFTTGPQLPFFLYRHKYFQDFPNTFKEFQIFLNARALLLVIYCLSAQSSGISRPISYVLPKILRNFRCLPERYQRKCHVLRFSRGFVGLLGFLAIPELFGLPRMRTDIRLHKIDSNFNSRKDDHEHF